jgi:putative photosynthetic complex assembly protein 2
MWTFMILWGMRQSSKLNVFLGVRNLNEEFLPKHLMFLKSFMKRRPMNPLFPVSIGLGTWLTVMLVQRAAAPGISTFNATGLSFLITMMALGVIEHWFLVLPLPFARIWGWWLRRCGRAEPLPPRHAPAAEPAVA